MNVDKRHMVDMTRERNFLREVACLGLGLALAWAPVAPALAAGDVLGEASWTSLPGAERAPVVRTNALWSAIATHVPGWVPLETLAGLAHHDHGTRKAFTNTVHLALMHTQVAGRMPLELGLGVGHNPLRLQVRGRGEHESWLERSICDVYVSMTW